MSAFFIGFGVLVKGHANIYDLVRGIKGMQKNTLNNLIMNDIWAAQAFVMAGTTVGGCSRT
jgi:hypothetical protein